MTGFIETASSGGMVPISAIVRIGEEFRDKDKTELRTAKLFDGSKFDLFEHEIYDLRMRAAQIIPSLPGIKYLRLAIAPVKTDIVVVDEPVVAWALCLDGAVRPVTPNGVCGGMGWAADHFVEMPDGNVQTVGADSDFCSFDDRADMLRCLGFASEAADPHADLFAEWAALDEKIAASADQGDEDVQPDIDRQIAVEKSLLAAPATNAAQAKLKLALLAKMSAKGMLLAEDEGKALSEILEVLS